MRNLLLGGLVVACVALGGCDRSVATEVDRPRLPPDAAVRVKLGQSTPADVEKEFGAPDQRAEDGSLIYESRRTRPSGKVEHETTKFQFQGGVLSKICTTRS